MRQQGNTAYDVDMRYSGDHRQRQVTQATAFTQAYQLAQPAQVARATVPSFSQSAAPVATGSVGTQVKKRLLLWLGIPLVLLFVLSSVLWAYAVTRPADTVSLQSQPSQEAPALIEQCTTDGAKESANCDDEAVATKKARVKYTCPDKYELHRSEGEQICRKHVAGELIAKTASVKYVCPSGYTAAGSYCQGIKTLPVTTTYTCPQGYTRSGTVCKDASSGATRQATARKSCPAGYYISSNSCKKSVTVRRIAVYYCASGYELQGKTCYARTAGTYATTKPTETVTCPDGFTRREGTEVCEARTTEFPNVQIEQE